ncbi:MAG: glycoside hydrolase [Verrucomicrobiae bacterium]|nr:glycoside hydrolase [Verrucomicrobiae bacterium]
MKLDRKVIAYVLLLIAKPVFGIEPRYEEQHLFTAQTYGYHHYRIPGIVITEKGTLIAWSEARKEQGDWADIDIAVRRSFDSGKTWTDQTILVDGDSLGITDADEITAKGSSIHGATQGTTAHNMVMIPDGNRIHMIFCVEYSRAFYAFSEDEGATISEPVEITYALEEIRDQYNWKVIATGPGHSIRLRSGRLIVPAWISTAEGQNAHHPSIVGVIYTEDRGSTWHAGDIVVKDKDPYNFDGLLQSYIDPNESVALELADGRVMINSRSDSPENRRIVTIGPNGATDWGKPTMHNDLWDPVCHGSLVRLTKKPEYRKNRILFTNPNSIERSKRYHTTWQRRENVTIRMSYDEGKTWPVSKVLDAGPSGYSDMSVGPDGTVYVLYEKGQGTQNLTLARLNVEWLTDGKDSLRKNSDV